MPVGAAMDWLRVQSKDPQVVRNLLSDAFVLRRVMWKRLEMESADYVLSSLTGLEPTLRRSAKDFAGRRSDADKVLGAWLEHWANAAALCAKAVRDGVAEERDPANTGMDMDARDFYLGPIGHMRLSAYPAVTMLLAALPEADPVRDDAVGHLKTGIDDLRRYAQRYEFSQEKMEQLGFFPSSTTKGSAFGLPPDLKL
jgi:hypothetical protein